MPNSCPFKEEVLKEVEAGRQRKQEMKDKRRDEMKQRREEAKAQAIEEKRTKVRALITRPGRINITPASYYHPTQIKDIISLCMLFSH